MNIEKSVLISIQPKWCKLIALGKKTVEVRKTKPKLETPFKCYIYETKAPKLKYVWTKKDYEGYPWFEDMDENEKTFCKFPQGSGKVIGEFVCDEIGTYEIEGFDKNNTLYQSIRRHIYDEEFEHTLSFTEFSNDMEQDEIPEEGLLKQSCLTFEEIAEYIIGDKEFNFYTFYGWHISNLVIYDKPKELGGFIIADKEALKQCEYRERVYQNPDYVNGAWLFGGCVCHKGEIDWCCDCKRKPLKRPPQSWCYVEGVEGGVL